MAGNRQLSTKGISIEYLSVSIDTCLVSVITLLGYTDWKILSTVQTDESKINIDVIIKNNIIDFFYIITRKEDIKYTTNKEIITFTLK